MLQNEHKGASKRGGTHTRGTAMSFGFRRRPASGIPMPISGGYEASGTLHQRSKSAGPEQSRRHDEDNGGGNPALTLQNCSSSGRSTPRLAPPKKESSGIAVRTNRFGYRQQQPQAARFTNKVGDVCSSHTASHYNQESRQQEGSFAKQPPHRGCQPSFKLQRSSPVHNTVSFNGGSLVDGNRRAVPSGIPEPVGR